MNSDFPFLYVCDLLEDLWGLHDPNRPQLLSREKAKKTSEKFIEWLKSHRDGLNACNKEDDPVSRMLRPESSMDRVNGMNAEKLERIIARVLRLPWKQVVELQKWRCGPPHGDLAACVEKVVEITDHDNPHRGLKDRLTVQEVDQALLRISAFNENSSPAVRSLAEHILKRPDIELGELKRDDLREFADLYGRVPPRDGKWLTRLILKNYAPIEIPDATQILGNHSGLPNMMNLKAEFNQPRPIPLLRNGYCGWIRAKEPAEARNNPLPTTPTRPPDPSPITTPAPGLPQSPITISQTAAAAATNVVTPSRGTAPKRVRIGELISSSALVPTPVGEVHSNETKNSKSISLAPNILTPLSINCPPRRSQSREMTVATSSETSLSGMCEIGEKDDEPISLSKPIPNPETVARGLARSKSRERTSATLTSTLLSSACRKRARDDEPISLSTLIVTPETSARRLRGSKSREPACSSAMAMLTSGTGVCLLTPHICPLTNCIFLLTPCIASLARLTQELLPWHGARYVLTPEVFSYPSFPLQCPRTSKKIRKIVLVESRHTAKTVEFLNSISTLELKKTSGEKEWVEVYDYRLLEMVAKVDRNIDREPGYNPWGKCWIGAV